MRRCWTQHVAESNLMTTLAKNQQLNVASAQSMLAGEKLFLLARGQTLPVVLSELSTGLKSTLGRLPGENKENKKLQNMLPTANTDGDDSGNSSSDRPVKKRKATYLVNKEEKARLNHEVQELEAQLAALKDRVGLTGGQSLDKVATSNVVLSNVLRQQQLLVATAQAGLAACTRGSPNPLYSYIHLGEEEIF
ncbi:hypothetical protein PC118_g8492 [Phytophthora cactorum]|uniref:Uncharacterized protein n=1 Tax=Phytophthora cactorum TaxID=29920 RepID=A0A8T1G7F9_9STRA|nr:hypothetical protein PC118_g8492 [Phytophthora cactorum]